VLSFHGNLESFCSRLVIVKTAKIASNGVSCRLTAAIRCRSAYVLS